jgi:hypothetical protein
MTIPANIPAGIAPLLRSGALMALSLAADDISTVAGGESRAADRDAYTVPLQRFDGARSLLDALGWQDDAANEEPVCIDLAPHRVAVAEAAALAIEHADPSAQDRQALGALR